MERSKDWCAVKQARRGHHVIAEDLAPLLEALVPREHRRRCPFIVPRQLEEQLDAGARDRQIADFIND